MQASSNRAARLQAAEDGDVLGKLDGGRGFAGDYGDLVGDKVATYLAEKRTEADDCCLLRY